MPNPYEVLGVEPGSDKDAVRAAYRRIAQIYHPDRFVGADDDVRREAERRMADANGAYAELAARRFAPPPRRSPVDDSFGAAWPSAPPRPSPSPPPTPPTPAPVRAPFPRRLVDIGLAAMVVILAVVAVLARSSPSSSAGQAKAQPSSALPSASPEPANSMCPGGLLVAVQPFTYRRTGPTASYRVAVSGTAVNKSSSTARLYVITVDLLDDRGATVHRVAAVPAVGLLTPGQTTTWLADTVIDSARPPTKAHAQLSFALDPPSGLCTAHS